MFLVFRIRGIKNKANICSGLGMVIIISAVYVGKLWYLGLSYGKDMFADIRYGKDM